MLLKHHTDYKFKLEKTTDVCLGRSCLLHCIRCYTHSVRIYVNTMRGGFSTQKERTSHLLYESENTVGIQSTHLDIPNIKYI